MSRRASRRSERRRPQGRRQPGSAAKPRQARRRAPARAGRAWRTFNWVPVLAVLGVGAIIAVIVFTVLQTTGGDSEPPPGQKAELDDNPKLPGVFVAPHPGPDGQFDTADDRGHRGSGVKIPLCTAEQIKANEITNCYHSNPPTSGPHGDQPMPWGILQNPALKENLLHNMEHGGVIIWYNTTNTAVIDQLKSIVNEQRERRKLVVMSQYTEMEPETIALTGWTRLDKFSANDLSKKRVEEFINAHERRFNPEGF